MAAFLGFVLWWSIAATAVTVSANGATELPWCAACGSETFAPLARAHSRRHSRLVAGGAGRSRLSSLARRGVG